MSGNQAATARLGAKSSVGDRPQVRGLGSPVVPVECPGFLQPLHCRDSSSLCPLLLQGE